jgi:hypothetical protein
MPNIIIIKPKKDSLSSKHLKGRIGSHSSVTVRVKIVKRGVSGATYVHDDLSSFIEYNLFQALCTLWRRD